MVVRGHRSFAMLLGALGATLQITAISQVVTNLADPYSIAAYAGGVGAGVLVGSVAGDVLTPGTIAVTLVTTTPAVAEGLWSRGWPATVQPGHGQDGPVDIVFVNINRRHEAALREDVVRLAPDASWSAGEQIAPARA